MDEVHNEVEEMYESWVNGNHRHVVEQVMEMPRKKAVSFTAALVGLMSEEDRGVFQRLVEAHRLPGMKR